MNASEKSRFLVDRAAQIGVNLNLSAADEILKFCGLLSDYNQHTNLVGKADLDVLIENHVLDSLTLVPFIQDFSPQSRALSLIDIGSGGGFPALVLSIVLPEATVVLVDSVGKKTRFLSQAAAELGLERRVTVVTARAEELGHKCEFREDFDLATARAVGHLKLVCELTLPLLKTGGLLLAQKTGKQAQSELAELQDGWRLLGGGQPEIVPLAAVADKDRAVVKVRKESGTADKYPRAGGQLNKPLS